MIEKQLTIDGETHVLKYPNSVARKIDKQLGYSALHLLEKADKHGTMAAFDRNDMITVIWGGMITEKPTITIDQVDDMIPLRLDEFTPIATEVFNILMEMYGIDGKAKITQESEGNEEARGTGKKLTK